MGRYALANIGRRKLPAVAAAIVAPAAVLFAVGGDVDPSPVKEVAKLSADTVAEPLDDHGPRCCMEIVSVPAASSTVVVQTVGMSSAQAQPAMASRWRVINIPQLLPVGIAPEQGLQVKTILAARSVHADFPEIREIGGVRPDALRWHPNGLALDVMIPNPSSAEGIALGNRIVAYALKNADRFALQDAIWRGTYYTPDGGAQSGGYGHYDHVHLTTKGGGYPAGGELYLR
ncbi:hypothetical protein M2272_005166 [Mycobacterium frederiksbergense]|uniref:ARB-07466-like C-terminal domain-containing protein n=1 Tax=Mycolicibacterium frederiksbergense TaxID=117567 RepID=A0ABT6L6B8_9MYCO|nr:hypothetical protein [Mycolicibacterium frederiksbergense]MDH6198507.1 hypothetical protein [Mycolicibacterium frederiksbergense]